MFDLDGTLVDTVPDIAVALNAALTDLSLPVVDESQVRDWVGNGARVLCGQSISRSMHDRADPALADRLLGRFLIRYAERVCVETRIYDGVLDCVRSLQTRGIALACVTNKPGQHTQELLDALGLASFFDVVVAGDTLPSKKPDPAPLKHVLEQLRVSPSAAMMIGDSRTDIAAARGAGVRSACVTYGYNHGDDVRALGADHVIDSLREVSRLPGIAA